MIDDIGRAEVNQTEDRLDISVPSFKNWIAHGICAFNSLIIPLFLFISGEYKTDLIYPAMLFAVLFGAEGFWGLFGKEIVTIENGQITMMKKLFFFFRKWRVSLNEISKISAVEVNTDVGAWGTPPSAMGHGPGKVRFYANQSMYSFGLELAYEDACTIADIMNQWIKDKSAIAGVPSTDRN